MTVLGFYSLRYILIKDANRLTIANDEFNEFIERNCDLCTEKKILLEKIDILLDAFE